MQGGGVEEMNLEIQKLQPSVSSTGGLRPKSGWPNYFDRMAGFVVSLYTHVQLRTTARAHTEQSLSLMRVEGEGGEEPCSVELEEAAVQNGIQRRQAPPPPCQSCVTPELRLIRVRRSTYQVR